MITNDDNLAVIRIKRVNSNSRIDSYFQDFTIKISKDMTILDGLFEIKSNFDSSLTFRSSCEDGICGSCAVAINGVSGLACESLISDFVNSNRIVEIAPVEGLPVIKDLVTDSNPIWEKYNRIKPWIINKAKECGNENIVYPEEVKTFDNVEKCISCGICYSSCPILIRDNDFIGPHAMLKAFQKVNDKRETAPNIHLSYLQSLWSCTTCYRCNSVCPVQVKPGLAGIHLRSRLVENFMVPKILGNRLTSIYEDGNPYGMKHNERETWSKGLQIPNAIEQSVEVCFINCCSSCYDPNLQEIIKNIMIFSRGAGVTIGNLGNEEKCCGSEVYRLGETGLFDYIVHDRSEILNNIKANEIVCNSPHCYDVFKNLYSEIKIPIRHYSQFIADLIFENRVKFSKRINKKVTFHDPCYLAIQNKIYNEPRFVLESIPGLELIEMEHNRENSMCCGGGGGNIWNDIKPNARISYQRIEEALKTGAEFLVTACPFCYTELGDAVKTMRLTEKLQVIDLIQLVLMAN